MNKLKFTLPKDIAHNIQFFWPNGFLKRFLKYADKFSSISNLSLRERGLGPFFNKLESLLFKDALSQVWLKLTQWFWRRTEVKKVQSLWVDGQTDGRRTNGDKKSSPELSLQAKTKEFFSGLFILKYLLN